MSRYRRAEPAPTWHFLARKVLEIVVVVLGATFFMFLLSHIIPGDPIRALFGFRTPPPEVLAELRDQYGLDDPFLIQYGKYLRNLAQGEMGYSVYGAPVSGIIARGLPISLKLLSITLIIQVTIGIGAAVIATIFHRRFLSALIQVTALLVLTVPIFAIAYTMQGVFGQQLGWFPVRGLYGGWRSLALPAFTLAVVSTAMVVRMAHVQLLDTLEAPFIRTHQANGIPRARLVGVHALRASLVPIVTLIAATASQIIAGLIIVETVYQVPGVGYSVYEAIRAKDHNVIVGILVMAVLFVVIVNLSADILNGIIDPRLRQE